MTEPIDEFRPRVSARITEVLASLLQDKHLYQSITVNDSDLQGLVFDAYPSVSESIRNKMLITRMMDWTPVDRTSDLPRDRHGRLVQDKSDLLYDVPHTLTLFCNQCKRCQPFNFLHFFDAARSTKRNSLQVHAFAYECQGCKLSPDVFLVRREEMKLTLCGRAPIERVDVPRDIPAGVSSYFSGAVIAHQCGQTLAGLFLLRVLIEQWVRPFGQANAKANESADAYMSSLPADFKEHYPSLAAWYEKLSVAIHLADGDPEIFDQARKEIAEHFEARRVRKLGAAP